MKLLLKTKVTFKPNDFHFHQVCGEEASVSTVYLHTLGFMQAVGFYTFKNISTSRTTSPAALAQHHKSVSTSKAFFWLLNAVKNRGLNAETCFLKHKKAKYAFVSLQVWSLYLLFGNFVICYFVEEKIYGHILQSM